MSRYPRLIIASLAILCLCGIFWIWSEWDFRISKPRELQYRLLGSEIATYSDLQRASNGCCAMDGSGILDWTYAIAPKVAAELAKRCRLPTGGPRPFINTDAPYYDVHSKQCIVARRYDVQKEEDATAEIKGTTLMIRLFYVDT